MICTIAKKYGILCMKHSFNSVSDLLISNYQKFHIQETLILSTDVNIYVKDQPVSHRVLSLVEKTPTVNTKF